MIIPKLGLSNKFKIPILKVGSLKVYPWQVRRAFQVIFKSSRQGSLFKTRLYGYRLDLTAPYFEMAVREREIWEKLYAPSSIKDKVVLDVGAGCGESAAFYFSKGAKKIFAVEPDCVAFKLLEQNSHSNNWNIECINQPFSPSMLDLGIDFAKIDCEGGESALVDYQKNLPSCIIESHSEATTKLLKERFHFSGEYKPLSDEAVSVLTKA